MMVINGGNPPNIDEIAKVFDLNGKSPVFTYGDILFNPSGGHIDAPLMTHEEVHAVQQAGGPKEWWDKYLVDPQFRLAQEVIAYHQQYNHFCRNKKDILRREEFLARVARDLSSDLYGNICTFDKARGYIITGTV